MSFFDQFRGDKGAAPPPGDSPLWGDQGVPRRDPQFSQPNQHPQPSYSGPPVYPTSAPVHIGTPAPFRASIQQAPVPIYPHAPSRDPAPPVFAFEVRPDHSMAGPPPLQYGVQPVQYVQHNSPPPAPTQTFLESTEATFMYTKQLVLEKLGKAQVP